MKHVVLSIALSTGVACAEGQDTVRIHASFQSAPTEWCQADQGVPVIVTVSGLTVYGMADAAAELPLQVKVRRGGQPTERVEVGRVGVAELRSRRGTEVSTVEGLGLRSFKPRIDELTRLGTLFSETQRCHGLWHVPSGTANWRVENDDGETVMSGRDRSFREAFGHVGGTGDFPRAFKIGDQVFVAMQEPEFVRTTEAFASPAEEQ